MTGRRQARPPPNRPPGQAKSEKGQLTKNSPRGPGIRVRAVFFLTGVAEVSAAGREAPRHRASDSNTARSPDALPPIESFPHPDADEQRTVDQGRGRARLEPEAKSELGAGDKGSQNVAGLRGDVRQVFRLLP